MSRPVLLARVCFVLLLCLLVPACKSKINKANFEKIKDGMTLAEVEKILGKGTKDVDTAAGTAAQFGVALPTAPAAGGGETWKFDSADGAATITVHLNKDGKVTGKQAQGKGF